MDGRLSERLSARSGPLGQWPLATASSLPCKAQVFCVVQYIHYIARTGARKGRGALTLRQVVPLSFGFLAVRAGGNAGKPLVLPCGESEHPHDLLVAGPFFPEATDCVCQLAQLVGVQVPKAHGRPPFLAMIILLFQVDRYLARRYNGSDLSKGCTKLLCYAKSANQRKKSPRPLPMTGFFVCVLQRFACRLTNFL